MAFLGIGEDGRGEKGREKGREGKRERFHSPTIDF
jgi:hypothetical protein